MKATLDAFEHFASYTDVGCRLGLSLHIADVHLQSAEARDSKSYFEKDKSKEQKEANLANRKRVLESCFFITHRRMCLFF
jgi:hypothetical protein